MTEMTLIATLSSQNWQICKLTLPFQKMRLIWRCSLFLSDWWIKKFSDIGIFFLWYNTTFAISTNYLLSYSNQLANLQLETNKKPLQFLRFLEQKSNCEQRCVNTLKSRRKVWKSGGRGTGMAEPPISTMGGILCPPPMLLLALHIFRHSAPRVKY